MGEKKRRTAVMFLVMLAGWTSLGVADTALTGVVADTGYNNYPGESCGWQFIPATNIKVTKLGYWTALVGPLNNSVTITIYDSAGQAKVTGTIPAGVSLAKEGGYAYVSVMAQNVVLDAGQTYTIASYWALDMYWNLDVQWAAAYSVGSSLITLGQMDLKLAGQTMPRDVGNTWNTFLSANFQFELANQPPVAGDVAASTEAGSSVTVNVLAAASDPDGDALSVAVGAAAHGTVAASGNNIMTYTPSTGVAANGDNTVTYTPNTGFEGIDAFSYIVSDGKGGTATGTVRITVSAKTVGIDIKPGGYPNSINLGSNGVVPVAILSTGDFDAATVDPATVSLAGMGVAVRGKANRYLASSQDVDGDGLLDLVLQVETENLDSSQLLDGYATITGKTFAGVPITGTDEITIVPQ